MRRRMRRRALPGRCVQQHPPTCGEKQAAVPDSGRQRASGGMAEGRAAGEDPAAAAGPTAEAAGEEGAPAPGDGGGEGPAEGRAARDEDGAGLALRVEFRGLPRASLERLNAALADWARFHRGLAAADGGSAAAPGLLSGELKFVPPTAGAEEALVWEDRLTRVSPAAAGPAGPLRRRSVGLEYELEFADSLPHYDRAPNQEALALTAGKGGRLQAGKCWNCG